MNVCRLQPVEIVTKRLALVVTAHAQQVAVDAAAEVQAAADGVLVIVPRVVTMLQQVQHFHWLRHTYQLQS